MCYAGGMRRTILVTIVGGKLDDYATEQERHEKWRPTRQLTERFRPAVIHLLSIPKFMGVCAKVIADLREVSPETEVVVHPLPPDADADIEDIFGALYEVACALPLDPETDDILVHITNGMYQQQISMFLLAEARVLPGRVVITHDPARAKRDPIRLLELDLARFDQLAARAERRQRDGVTFLKDGIATLNDDYNALIARIEHVVTVSRAPVVLWGPTGAGKSALAKRIYRLWKQRGDVTGEFVAVNCATLRGDGALSALFGHVAGAYTGAASSRDGFLRRANGGVLFLDEIGELGLDEQAMLLDAIEERAFRPYGADHLVESDFLLVCGTNRDLLAAVAAGRFREDLRKRIGLWTFRLPGLSERLEDLEPNLDFELRRCGEQLKRRVAFSREARARYLEFAHAAPWPGNFRDLAASVQRMATLCAGGRITEADVAEEIVMLRAEWGLDRVVAADGGATDTLRADVVLGARAGDFDLYDRLVLEAVLRVCEGTSSLSEAGRLLFGKSRTARAKPNDAQRLARLLAKYGLERRMMWR